MPALLPELPAPDVPAVEPADPDVLPPAVEPEPPAVEPEPDVLLPVEPEPDAPAPVEPLDAPEPIIALVSIHCELLPDVPAEALPPAPLEPLVPVAPAVAPPPRCKQPVTVTVRLLWLPLCELVPACAARDAAHPSAIANVAPVHTRFMGASSFSYCIAVVQ
jgi:hypothetical protein